MLLPMLPAVWELTAILMLCSGPQEKLFLLPEKKLVLINALTAFVAPSPTFTTFTPLQGHGCHYQEYYLQFGWHQFCSHLNSLVPMKIIQNPSFFFCIFIHFITGLYKLRTQIALGLLNHLPIEWSTFISFLLPSPKLYHT